MKVLAGGALIALLLTVFLCSVNAGWAGTVSVDFNGLQVGVDTVTGGIVSMSHPATGRVLETTPEMAGLVDVAYPIHEFGPLRLATRFSKARVVQGKDELTITWDELGPSRTDYALPHGKVAAQVKLKPAPNGRSVIFTCRIDNRSAAPVPQIMFPDLAGIRPFAGLSKTTLTVSGALGHPFAKPVRNPHDSRFYPKGMGWTEYDAPDGNRDGLGRVYLAGPAGGVSFFQKDGQHPAERVFTHRKEASPESMRLMWEHQDAIAPGASWESGEYWITPFKGSLSEGVPDLRKLNINGMVIGLDGDTGNVLHLSHPATGLLLDCESWMAGLIEVGSAQEKDDPLDEVSSQYSKARVEERDGGVDIVWDELRPAKSREPVPSGKITARVMVRPAPDGKSAILSCRVQNGMGTYMRLVRFPDLHNLKPAGDAAQTRVKLSRSDYQPFVQKPDVWTEKPNPLTWLDYGSFKSGISVFQRKWNRSFTEIRPVVMTYFSEANPTNLRLALGQRMLIKPGETWESGEYWLTPHEGGWAKGIEPFRDYVRQVSVQRKPPKHVAEELGFRTVFMTQPAETTAERAAFTFKDLPQIAKEAKEHGLYEVVPWFWCPYFDLPITVRKELGTREEFIAGVSVAKQMGVNITPFISVNIIVNEHAGKYGVAKGEGDWTYHTEVIPNFRPYYTKHQMGARLGGGTSVIDPVWLKDVESTLMDWIEGGVTSFCWDLWYSHPELLEMIGRVRKTAQAKDPQSSFAGEVHSFEQDGEVLDYTWNWAQYYDSTPIINVLPYPRFNCNVEASPRAAKMAFCDGLHLNVMPKRPDQPNATAYISEEPELSSALKECAKLRKQFLSYFLDGIVIGDSVLYEPSNGFVRGYQLDKRLLVFALNNTDTAGSVKVRSNLSLWLPKAGSYQVKYYNSAGDLVQTTKADKPDWTGMTRKLKPAELAIFEIQVQ